MKKNFFILFLLFFINMFIRAQSPHPFKMRSSQLTNYIPVNRTISSLDSIDLDTVNIPIEGLSVTGMLLQPCDSSFVRILLEDTLGVEYVVLESSRLYNDVDTLMLDDYCMETSVLLDIVPRKVRVFIRNATITVDSIKYITHNSVNGNLPHHINLLHGVQNDILHEQALALVTSINNYNVINGKLWRADTSFVDTMSWNTKKRVFDIHNGDDTGGFEYYATGIFEFGSSMQQYRDTLSSSYVNHFDWRNRHGRNWITSVKNQGNGDGCWAFSAIGVTEALVNLYFNRPLNYNLSEQEVISCSGGGSNAKGGSSTLALMWIANHGVSEESAFPFSCSDESCENKGDFNEIVSINSMSPIQYNIEERENQSKHALIQYGPLLSGYRYRANNESNSHAMALVGYGTLHAGDTIRFFNSYNQSPNDFVIIGEDDARIGKTYWIFKNSYGNDRYYDHEGFSYILFNDQECFTIPRYATTPIQSLIYSDDDIICEDADGDGYYFWGIGSKPPHCPVWVPDEPDGDDSDDTKGPMNEYGYLYDLMEHINDTLYVNSDTVWNQKRYLYNHVAIQNGAKLTIASDVIFYKTVTMTVRDGGILLLDGGKLLNANVKIDEMSGSTMNIMNNGIIERRNNNSFLVPLGNKMTINYGKIQ